MLALEKRSALLSGHLSKKNNSIDDSMIGHGWLFHLFLSLRSVD